MNVLTLLEKPEQLSECIALIEHSFNYPEEFSYKEDFALLVDDSNLENCYFIEQDNEVVATLFTLPRKFIYKDQDLPVLFLGGISVKDEQRGGGLFRSLLETVSLLNSHYSLFLLWSDLSSLYEKFSFHEFGLIEEVKNENFSDLKKVTPEKLIHLRESYNGLKEKFLVPERTDKDWDLLFKSSTINFLQDEKGSTYLEGKGFDLQGICHEYYLAEQSELVGAAKYWDYDPKQGAQDLRYMGFLRLGNLESLSQFIEKTSNGRLKNILRDDSLIVVEFDGERFELSDKDFIQGLWGPGKVSEWVGFVPPIRVMGFDSI